MHSPEGGSRNYEADQNVEVDRATARHRAETGFAGDEYNRAVEKLQSLEQQQEELKRMMAALARGDYSYGADTSTEAPTEATVEDNGGDFIGEPSPKATAPAPAPAPTKVESIPDSRGQATHEKDDDRKKETKKRAKKSNGARNHAKAAVLAAISALGFIGGAFAYKFFGNKNRANEGEDLMNNRPAATEVEQNKAEQIGIYDGYGERGMFLSKNKTSEHAFSDASEVYEVCQQRLLEKAAKNEAGSDAYVETEMIKYTGYNEVEALGAYYAHLPDKLIPDGFKGLEILEADAKLESMSPEGETKARKEFESIMDKAKVRHTVVNGPCENSYLREQNPDQAVVHENMELVRCTTEEHNLEITQFYWEDEDGNEIGTMNVKYTPIRDQDGKIIDYKGCGQPIDPVGSPLYKGLPTITENDPTKPGPVDPDKPGPVDPDKPDDLASKTPENGGPNVTQLDLDETVTGKTNEGQDYAGFADINRQASEERRVQIEAERVAAEQHQREEEAKVVAAERAPANEAIMNQSTPEQIASADQAEVAAVNDAASEQASRAPAEAAAATEATERQEAQDQAQAAAAAATAEATAQYEREQQASQAGQAMDEFNANILNNGDF